MKSTVHTAITHIQENIHIQEFVLKEVQETAQRKGRVFCKDWLTEICFNTHQAFGTSALDDWASVLGLKGH